MGISKKAFEASKGFGNIHPGEDPDFSIRLWNLGFETRLFPEAYVYHKRRIDWEKFSIQVNKFGIARPILNSWYPEHNKLTFFFPSVFILGLLLAFLLLIFNIDILLQLYFVYFVIIFLTSSIQNKSIKIGYLICNCSLETILWLWNRIFKSFIKIILLKKKPQEAFPRMFFKV